MGCFCISVSFILCTFQKKKLNEKTFLLISTIDFFLVHVSLICHNNWKTEAYQWSSAKGGALLKEEFFLC
jgi:hypothetical protein